MQRPFWDYDWLLAERTGMKAGSHVIMRRGSFLPHDFTYFTITDDDPDDDPNSELTPLQLYRAQVSIQL